MPVLRRRKPMSREQSLTSIPVRNEAIEQERTDEGTVRLIIPRRDDWWVRAAARFFYVPKRRRIVLDEIGSFVWELCDGDNDVRRIIRALAERYQLHRKEAEVSVVAYLRQLAKRRLIAIAVLNNGGQKAQDSRST
ncbi:MAG: PqqD family protein [Planctomycetota bacterium]